MSIFEVLLLVFICLFVLYGPLADLLFHVLGIGTITRGSELAREIALTFDDGPDPSYTPELLQLLAEHQAQAVFFVIAEKARRHPELVTAIRNQGHIIANHTDSHHNAWFQTPWRTSREIVAASATLAAITGEPTHYFRPPWGRFNLWQRMQLKRSGLTPILWTFTCRDWRAGDQSAAIVETLLGQAQSGAIVLLHDSGGAPTAPANTLQALRVALPRLRAMGFTFTARPVTQSAEAQTRRRGSFPRLSQRLVHPLWRRWDQFFDLIYRVYPMTRMFRLSVVAWRFGDRLVEGAASEAAATTTTSQATSDLQHPGSLYLRNGQPMVELHLQNLALQELVKIASPEKMAIRGLREVRDSLRDVAQALVYDERFQAAQGVFGMTMMHRGMDKLGFHLEDVPNTLFNRWIGLLLTWIMVLYHPQGRKRLRYGMAEMHPRLMWMTRSELLARYLPAESTIQEKP